MANEFETLMQQCDKLADDLMMLSGDIRHYALQRGLREETSKSALALCAEINKAIDIMLNVMYETETTNE